MKIRTIVFIIMMWVFDIGVLILYGMAINITKWAKDDSNDKEHLGWSNSAIIGLSDSLLILEGLIL